MSVSVSIQTKVCIKCEEIKLISKFSKKKDSKDGYRNICKDCVKVYRSANPEKIKEGLTKWHTANPDKRKEYSAKYRADNPDKCKEYSAKYRQANPEKCKASLSKCRKENPEKGRTNLAKRRATKLLAIPYWLTQEDYKAIEVTYKEASKLTQETGIKHNVDHIIPLQGKLVCGFHCPANLQILTESENKSKSNRFTPYVESELG